MRSALSAIEVERPRTLAGALRLLHDSLAHGRLTPLAGGTDLFVALNAGTHPDGGFLDLSRLSPLRAIRATAAGGVRIGALATYTDIASHAAVRRACPSLIASALVTGAAQIQNRGTLGGNLANASPAGDSLPVLLAHDAMVRAASVRGERKLAIDGFFTGYRRLALEPDELIVAIELPPARRGAHVFFRKVGTRAAQSISKVVMSGALVVGRSGTIAHVRLAWGSMAPVPLRSRAAEAALAGARPGAAAREAALAALERDLAPIDDVRSERDYRMAVARALLAQFLRTAHPAFARG